MRKLLFYLFVFFMMLYQSSDAQRIEAYEYPRSLMSIEIGGSGGYGSINYEYLLKKINKVKISVKIGISTYNLNDYLNKFNPDIIVPIAVSGYYGFNHNIELGVGQTITNIVYADKLNYKPNRVNNFNTNLTFGYRYHEEIGGLVFKIAYAPIIENNKVFKHWGVLALGYTF